ncbi:MAG: DUF1403 family protein [Pseudomonadota bacterium]
MEAGTDTRRLPRWMRQTTGQDLQARAFVAGGALAMLDAALHHGTAPQAVLRDRLALTAAQSALRLEGRTDPLSALRDAVCLSTGMGDAGPSGAMAMRWQALGRLKLSGSGWQRNLKALCPDGFELPQPGSGLTPLHQASQVIQDCLTAAPRHEATALMLGEVTLARAMGWAAPLPLLTPYLQRRDLVALQGSGDVTPVMDAAVSGAAACMTLNSTLSERAARLHAALPRLRSKGAAAAAALFLTRDAVAPTLMLAPIVQGSAVAMSDRAARRLCDRLVTLGVLRELTGRSVFRLYGL